ncbi:MAG: ATP synthase F1 subunit epsilon [Akkermansia sp.]
MALSFQIITPIGIILSEQVEHVYLPGSLGEMGILDHHTPIITALEPGELRYTPVGGSEQHLVVGDGYFQAENDQLLLVTDLALNSEQIDETSVEKAIATAQAALKEHEGMTREDQARFEANLTKQIAILSFKRKKNHL